MAAGGAGGGEKLLAKARAKEEAHVTLVKTNAETFRLSNDGKFPVKVSLAFEKQPQVIGLPAEELNMQKIFVNIFLLRGWIGCKGLPALDKVSLSASYNQLPTKT